MKNRKKQQARLGVHRQRLLGISVAIATSFVALAAITVVAKQLVKRKPSSTAAMNTLATQPAKKFVTVKVAGRDVQVDPQTGQIKPMTPEEAKQLADGLRTMLNKSTDGLVQKQHADGSVSMDLQNRFQNVVLARVNEDGRLEQSCVDEPEAAAQFFGIDPQLLGVDSQKRAINRAVTRTPAKKVNQ